MEINIGIQLGAESQLFDTDFYQYGTTIKIISSKPKLFSGNTENIIKDRDFVFGIFNMKPINEIDINMWLIPEAVMNVHTFITNMNNHYEGVRYVNPILENINLISLEFDLVIGHTSPSIRNRLLYKNIIRMVYEFQGTYGNTFKCEYLLNNEILATEMVNRSNGKFGKSQLLADICMKILEKIIAEKLANVPLDVKFNDLSQKYDELSDKFGILLNRFNEQVVPGNYSLIKDLVAEIAKRDTIIQELKNKIVSIKDFTEKICD